MRFCLEVLHVSESWCYEMAGLFRERDNPTTKLGACLGKVESVSPPIVSIQNGQFMIQGEQLYVCNQILERETTYKNHTGQYQESGNASISCHPCSGSFSSSGTIQSNGSIHLDEVWRVGDLVLVIPDERQQHFFIVDVVRNVLGCNSHAE